MIIIDGRQSSMEIGNFANLEEILVKVMENEVVSDHVVTDVIVNQEAFSEIYPHHAEDIEAEEIESVEVRTMSMNEMAGEVTKELFIVIKIMQSGSRGVAEMLRRGDTAEGLDVLQDLLEVTRNFLNTITLMHQRFPLQNISMYQSIASNLENLFTEMCTVMSEQDWLLLADLVEYEFMPACEEWEQIICLFIQDIEAAKVV
jgi:hypothetical protein